MSNTNIQKTEINNKTMWKVNKNAKNQAQATFRIPDAELDGFNAYVKAVGDEIGQDFSNGYEFVSTLIKQNKEMSNGLTAMLTLEEANKELTLLLEEKENTPVINPEITAKFDEIKESIFENNELSETEMLDALVEMVTFHSEPEIQIKEVEKVVEVERSLKENEVILSLDERNEKIVNHISLYRYKKGYDKEQLTKEQVIKNLAFNAATIVNWGGEFETGINSTRKFGR